MPSETLNLETRIKTLNTVLTEKRDRQTVDEALRAASGDMPAALESLKGKLPGAALQKVALAHSLAVLSDDHVSVVKALSAQAGITNLKIKGARFGLFSMRCHDSSICSRLTRGAAEKSLEATKEEGTNSLRLLFRTSPSRV